MNASPFFLIFSPVVIIHTFRIKSGLKSQVLKPTFKKKDDGEKCSRIFYFKILLAPLGLLLPSAKRSVQKGWIGLAG